MLTNEIIDFLSEQNFSIGISIDGFKKWNKHRKYPNGREVFDDVVKKINRLKEMSVDFSTLGVVYDSEQYLEYIKFAKKYGIEHFRLNTLTSIGRSTEKMDLNNTVSSKVTQYSNKYIKMSRELILNEEYHNYKEANLTYFLWSLLEYMPHMCFRNPCGAGRNQLHLTANGEFYPCQDWRSIHDASIGSVHSQEMLENLIKNNYRINRLNKSNLEKFPEICRECPWYVRCGVCPRELYTEYKGDGNRIGLCQFYSEVYEELLDLIFTNKKEVLNYLGVCVC